jgi:uncharacterized protein (DUF427 family)
MPNDCREPGPDHPITIAPAGRRVLVRAGGEVVADSMDALALSEAKYPIAYYIPRRDAAMDRYGRTDHHSRCPFKGEAAYYSLPGDKGTNAVWTYEDPCPAVAAIKGHLAFYPDRVDSIELG